MEASEPAAEVFILEEGFAPDWPQDIRERCAQLFSYDAEEIRGKNRLGSLSFDDAPEAVEGIKQIVRDIALEQWTNFPRI
ncbi:MAG: hypothetical protein JST31_03795 [Actinobacteria bacterium]|nr:hypothetical protein [Actinomycetota bacterium]